MFRDTSRFLLLLMFLVYGFVFVWLSLFLRPALQIIAYRGKVSSVGASWCTYEKEHKKLKQTHTKHLALYAFKAEKKNTSTVKRLVFRSVSVK